MRAAFLILLFSALVEVHCKPDLQIFSLKVPIPDKIGTAKNSFGVNVAVTKEGVEISKHQESTSENCDSSETHTNRSNQTCGNDDNSTSLSQDQSNTTKIQESSEMHKQTKDTGIKFGKGGLSLYEKEMEATDQSSSDQESVQTSHVDTETTANSSHSEDSGSCYNKTSQTHDTQEKSKEKSLTIGGGSGLFKRNSKTSESETHDASTHEDGRRWNQTEDYSKSGNSIQASSSSQNASFAKDDNESSAKNATSESETISNHLD